MRRDALDQLLERWAITRRELLGLSQPQTASAMLGPQRCTIGARRDLHAGSRSLGRVEQHWPEVYEGEAFEVNRAFKRLPEDLRLIVDTHYVALHPKSRAARAELLGLRRDRYYDKLRQARLFFQGALGL